MREQIITLQSKQQESAKLFAEQQRELGDLRQKYGEVRGVIKGVRTCAVPGCQWRVALGGGDTPPMGQRMPRKGDSDPTNPTIELP
ncbi:MAG: hypothetical protein JSR82_24365 [Verrucomicrobia bacterium]|nr:hypothetical protein [Verrucomicrobiota bacterium]